jgi:hypothetical protein
MKLSEFISLGPANIDVGSKKIENLSKGSQGEGARSDAQAKLSCILSPLFQTIEVSKFYHRYYLWR